MTKITAPFHSPAKGAMDAGNVYSFWGASPALDLKWLASAVRTLVGPTLSEVGSDDAGAAAAALAAMSVQEGERPFETLQVSSGGGGEHEAARECGAPPPPAAPGVGGGMRLTACRLPADLLR